MTMTTTRFVSLLLLGLLILSSFVIPVVDSLEANRDIQMDNNRNTNNNDALIRDLAVINVAIGGGTTTTTTTTAATTATSSTNPKTKIQMTIARPFSVIDLRRLSQSFDSWEDYVPCDSRKTTNDDAGNGVGDNVQVKLLLVYSRSLDPNDDNGGDNDDENLKSVNDVIDQVKKIYQKTNGWNSCISSIDRIGVNIDPSLDIYNASQQDTNPLWVNGPNRHFERTVRYLQHQQQDGNDETNSVVGNVMYWMEMDSVPVKEYWLDALVNEIQTRQVTTTTTTASTTKEGFAILGRYVLQLIYTIFYSAF